MLAYSGKGRFLVEELDLSDLVREMGRMMEVSISKKADVRYELATALPFVEADATQLRQVVMNLITNASEALGDGAGVIAVSTGQLECDRTYLELTHLDEGLREGRYVYLEVADTGCGMDEATRDRIFDPFFTTKFTGRGLGLAAVIGIARGHRGAIQVSSEQGKGSTFRILLPAAGSSRPRPREEDLGASGAWAEHATVLLADDEEAVRDVGGRMLQTLGLRVLTAADGQEAVDLFRSRPGEIDCVVLDLTMPRLGGEEAFRELKRIRENVRVVLSSGYNEQEVLVKFAGQGVAGFLQKPYTAASLREALRQAFDGGRAEGAFASNQPHPVGAPLGP
jgi:CheY-like chemotaxis protein